MDDTVFDALVRLCDAENETLNRMKAAEILSSAALTEEQLSAIVEKTIRDAGPIVLRTLLQAFEKNASPKLAMELITALEQSSDLSGRLKSFVENVGWSEVNYEKFCGYLLKIGHVP